MFERILERCRELVRAEAYVMTMHALDEMEEDLLTILDVETCILSGVIVERQLSRETGEWKYLIQGTTTSGGACVVVVKLTPVETLGS